MRERFYTDIPTEQLSGFNSETGCKAYNCKIYSGYDFDGKCSEGYSERLSIGDLKAGSVKFYSDINILKSGNYEFKIETDCRFCLKVNDTEILRADAESKPQLYKTNIDLESKTNIKFELYVVAKNFGSFDLKWSPEDNSMKELDELIAKAKKADLVIACSGLNHNYESEAWDRKNLNLPEEDNKVIPVLAKVNKNTIAVITAGAPVEIPWSKDVGALIFSWFYGMEGGNALADIITGKVNPSGKLPFTIAEKQEDYPCFRYGEYKTENCRYNEGLFVGYRGFDKDNIVPKYCFGYGKSYSTFKYSDMQCKFTNDGVYVSCKIFNDSDFDGKETVQVYLSCNENNKRPIRELIGFAKIFVKSKKSKFK